MGTRELGPNLLVAIESRRYTKALPATFLANEDARHVVLSFQALPSAFIRALYEGEKGISHRTRVSDMFLDTEYCVSLLHSQ
jgi:hypothetical protein